jgi:hypothetical protein
MERQRGVFAPPSDRREVHRTAEVAALFHVADGSGCWVEEPDRPSAPLDEPALNIDVFADADRIDGRLQRIDAHWPQDEAEVLDGMATVHAEEQRQQAPFNV